MPPVKKISIQKPGSLIVLGHWYPWRNTWLYQQLMIALKDFDSYWEHRSLTQSHWSQDNISMFEIGESSNYISRRVRLLLR